MITKGNDTKVQNEVIAQTITDESAKRLRLARLFPKQEIKAKVSGIYITSFKRIRGPIYEPKKKKKLFGRNK